MEAPASGGWGWREAFSGPAQPSRSLTDGMLPRRQNITRLLKGQLPQFTAPLNCERRLEFQMWEMKVDGGGRRPITDDALAPLHRPPEAL